MAERYSLLRKLTITEPSPHVLELNFTVADKEGAPRIAEQQNLGSGKTRQRRLERIAISPCSATEIKVRAVPVATDLCCGCLASMFRIDGASVFAARCSVVA